jgi:quinol-cytochrome oxidoreductase complex cytochrome b subunit
MKVIKTVYFTVFLIFINIYTVLADPDPLEPGPVEPPGSPIDSYLLVLIIAALVLGMVVIYNNKIKKASV